MREIKFRVWTGKEMITPPNECIGVGSSAELIEISIAGHISTRNAYGLDGFSKNPTFDEPITDYELMQFTGLKDKKGIEIYEGDIITCDIVEGLGEPRINDRKEVVSIGLYGNSITVFHTNIKVIGNIHQNPELL